MSDPVTNEENPKSPKGKDLFDESTPALFASSLIYLFADLAKIARDDKDKELDLDPTVRAAFDSGDTTGLLPQSFRSLGKVVMANEKFLEGKHIGDPEYAAQIAELRKVEGHTEDDTIFLEAFDSLNQEQECVYGIVRDDNTKTITVAFRGSAVMQDWSQNIQKMMVEMRTPKLLKRIMDDESDGKGAEHVLVHQGFYNYLFNNDVKETGKQQYDEVVAALYKVLKEPKYQAYKAVVTGHSLGGALATLVAFKLAGSEKLWLPRPVKCITFSSPRVGNEAFAKAFGILEREGFLRHLRVTNQEDIVPALVMTSILAFSSYDHVGMHLNLFSKDLEISYPSDKNWWKRALYGNVITKVGFPWNMMKYHGTALIHERMTNCKEDLAKSNIEDLYKEDRIVGDLYKNKSSTDYTEDFY
uniref:Fungal lipase-type domain-containing protein n=1 Tax=Asterionellopsis glacialis TaxID=33640 RepID=A0A7S0PWN4_9STRA